MNAPTAHPTVSARWLLAAAAVSLVAAAVCGWLTLCLLFWQGSWQLLYRPSSAVVGTPASAGIAFEPVAFAATEAGFPRLRGWWVPAATAASHGRFTVLYLHGRTGNLGDSVEALATLHALGLNVLAFDYRGYGQSQFTHPSEARWQEDAEWALNYLSTTRHVPAASILIDGKELGANLAFELAARHPELGGVVIESPLNNPTEAIFSDPRARLVPAHLLVRDRFDAGPPSATLRIPSLWMMRSPDVPEKVLQEPTGYRQVKTRKVLVWLPPQESRSQEYGQAYARWLDELPAMQSPQ